MNTGTAQRGLGLRLGEGRGQNGALQRELEGGRAPGRGKA
jgi:hypothetical protein